MKFKLHIARLLCLISILLIGGNVLANSVDYSVDYSVLFDHDHKHPGVHLTSNHGLSNSQLNLLKDPTEGDVDFLYVAEVLPSMVCETLFPKEEVLKIFFKYSPLLKSLPLWIENQQMRI